MTIKTLMWDFPGGPVVKNLPCNGGDTSSISDPETKIPTCQTVTKPASHI